GWRGRGRRGRRSGSPVRAPHGPARSGGASPRGRVDQALGPRHPVGDRPGGRSGGATREGHGSGRPGTGDWFGPVRLRVVRTAAALLCAAAVAIIPAPPAHANTIRSDPWHLDLLRISKVHRMTRGERVTVAVIDSGVEPHPDMRDNLLPGIDVADGGTGDGREDHDGHGTAMAGLIAAHGRGGNSGVLGIAPAAKILPIRYETPTMPGGEIGAGRRVAKGIDWAVAQGAKVINLSIGGGPAAELREAVERAIAAEDRKSV